MFKIFPLLSCCCVKYPGFNRMHTRGPDFSGKTLRNPHANAEVSVKIVEYSSPSSVLVTSWVRYLMNLTSWVFLSLLPAYPWGLVVDESGPKVQSQ